MVIMVTFNGSRQRQHLAFFLGYRFFVNPISTAIDALGKEIKIIQSNLNDGILRLSAMVALDVFHKILLFCHLS